MRLRKKVAIVTGSSPNIGGGIAEILAAEGAAVCCVDADPKNALDCAKWINDNGGKSIGVACDVRDDNEVGGAVARAVAEFGQIDILVNNATTFNRKGILAMSLPEWTDQTSVILTGAFLFTKHVAETIIDRAGEGSIINIVSTAGHQGEPNNIAYSTAKAGLLNFTRSAAMELIAKGIRVNSLTPTATDPSESFDRSRRWGRDPGEITSVLKVFDVFRRRIPMQKLPTPSDYGKAAVFLASDDARMITGTDLRIDAGAVARYWAWDPSAGDRVG